MKPYSMDLRERVLADCDAAELSTKAVAQKYSVSESWVRRLEQRRRAHGEIAPRTQRHGPQPSWQADGYADALRAAVALTPDATLEESQQRLGLAVAISTLWRACAALGLSLKKR